MAILDPMQLGIVPCVCGRLSTKRHCSSCGSYRLYAQAKKKAILPDPGTGEMKEWNIYRCQSCGIYFNDTEWQFDNCKAPIFRTKKTETLLTKAEKLNAKDVPVLVNNGKPFDMKEMLRASEELKKKYGIKNNPISTTSKPIENENKLIEDMDNEGL